ncbi:GHMP kinase N-terminal domain protein [Kalmanozyma brasiliensis GHG001]|uniref:Homoserine kinase n=1 Tax=Kalmanozyma brasiliensis (strain GHG001) TaxID=1365824 RepID=V5F0R1_KALBG|nr:GHMP kinase N-terminal domain protein [Kalmanozyma brasiliensis GHG001]EST08839.1 GHMP kinase N-terminal domain protein [Kalmanozyma brasiliensis GHG001]
MSARKFTITVPCTSSNIGPGFDVVGLSLSLYLTLKVTVDPSGSNTSPTLAYTGLGAEEAPLDAYKNLTTRTALYVLRSNGHTAFPVGVSIDVHNEVPFGRGLGSSGAAVVAGLLLGNELGQLGLGKDRLLDHALMIERHPDNVTAALMGGFVGSYLLELSPAEEERRDVPLSEVIPEYPPNASFDWGTNPPSPPKNIGHYIRFGWAPEIKVIAIIPDFQVSTASARSVLPETYSKKDLIFNLQRLAVLTTALTRSPPDEFLIYQAMQDKVHQPYRKNLIPGLNDVLASVTPKTHPGLLGICLSGAGPTILALATGGVEKIAEDVIRTFREKGGIERCDAKFLKVTEEGAQVTHE